MFNINVSVCLEYNLFPFLRYFVPLASLFYTLGNPKGIVSCF